jgi:hypothetical protein
MIIANHMDASTRDPKIKVEILKKEQMDENKPDLGHLSKLQRPN